MTTKIEMTFNQQLGFRYAITAAIEHLFKDLERSMSWSNTDAKKTFQDLTLQQLRSIKDAMSLLDYNETSIANLEDKMAAFITTNEAFDWNAISKDEVVI